MSDLAKTYNQIARHYDKANHKIDFWLKEFGFFRKLAKGKKIIDIGCGPGRDGVLFTKFGFDYTGIDVSKAMLKLARKRVKRGKFLLMDFYRIKFSKEIFDGFWASASLLHAPKKRIERVLRSIRNILKKDGVGFISVKQKKNLDEGVIAQNIYVGVKRFFAFYRKSEFQKILRASGFKAIKSYLKVANDEYKTRWLVYFVKKA